MLSVMIMGIASCKAARRRHADVTYKLVFYLLWTTVWIVVLEIVGYIAIKRMYIDKMED